MAGRLELPGARFSGSRTVIRSIFFRWASFYAARPAARFEARFPAVERSGPAFVDSLRWFTYDNLRSMRPMSHIEPALRSYSGGSGTGVEPE